MNFLKEIDPENQDDLKKVEKFIDDDDEDDEYGHEKEEEEGWKKETARNTMSNPLYYKKLFEDILEKTEIRRQKHFFFNLKKE